jgi:hypothetical protein
MIDYEYSKGNLFDKPESYFYSQYFGSEFLSSYLAVRHKKLSDLMTNQKQVLEPSYHRLKFLTYYTDETDYKFIDNHLNTCDLLIRRLLDKHTEDFEYIFKRLIQKFEISKKLNDQYSSKDLKPTGDNRNILVYILFGLVLIEIYSKTEKLKYFNALLKLSDLLCSVVDEESLMYRHGAAFILLKERSFIEELLNKNGIRL